MRPSRRAVERKTEAPAEALIALPDRMGPDEHREPWLAAPEAHCPGATEAAMTVSTRDDRPEGNGPCGYLFGGG